MPQACTTRNPPAAPTHLLGNRPLLAGCRPRRAVCRCRSPHSLFRPCRCAASPAGPRLVICPVYIQSMVCQALNGTRQLHPCFAAGQVSGTCTQTSASQCKGINQHSCSTHLQALASLLLRRAGRAWTAPPPHHRGHLWCGFNMAMCASKRLPCCSDGEELCAQQHDRRTGACKRTRRPKTRMHSTSRPPARPRRRPAVSCSCCHCSSAASSSASGS